MVDGGGGQESHRNWSGLFDLFVCRDKEEAERRGARQKKKQHTGKSTSLSTIILSIKVHTHTHTLANTLRSTTRLTTRPTTTKKTKQMKTADGSPKSSLRGDPKLIRLTCWRSTFHFFGCLAGTREVGVGWAAGGGPSGQGGPVAPLRRPQPSRKRKSLAAAKKLVAGQVDKRRSKEKKKKKNATFSLPSNPISTSNDKV